MADDYEILAVLHFRSNAVYDQNATYHRAGSDFLLCEPCNHQIPLRSGVQHQELLRVGGQRLRCIDKDFCMRIRPGPSECNHHAISAVLLLRIHKRMRGQNINLSAIIPMQFSGFIIIIIIHNHLARNLPFSVLQPNSMATACNSTIYSMSSKKYKTSLLTARQVANKGQYGIIHHMRKPHATCLCYLRCSVDY